MAQDIIDCHFLNGLSRDRIADVLSRKMAHMGYGITYEVMLKQVNKVLAAHRQSTTPERSRYPMPIPRGR